MECACACVLRVVQNVVAYSVCGLTGLLPDSNYTENQPVETTRSARSRTIIMLLIYKWHMLGNKVEAVPS